jgi:hypothetical protein
MFLCAKKIVFCFIIIASSALIVPLSGAPIAPAAVATNLNNVIAYPNPFKPSVSTAKGITFENLTQGDIHLRIFKLTGENIYDSQISSSNGKILWNVLDKNNNPVASGMYIYLISNDANQLAKGKIAVIK